MKTLLSASLLSSSAGSHPRTSPFAQRALTDAVECPRCGKRSIVERSSNVFDCLNCSFHKELPPVAHRANPRAKSHRATPPLATASVTSSSLHKRAALSHSAAYMRSTHPQQCNNLDTLLSSGPHHPSLDRLPLYTGDEMTDANQSNPWIFALIAVIFGIFLL